MKLELAKPIVKTYPDVDVAHFEIGYVTIRRDNIVIRCCQHLHEQDLNIVINEEDYVKYGKNEYKKQQAKLRPFKNYCYELFAANREQIEDIVFKHYTKLKQKKYNVIYHKEYPTDKNVDKILHGDQRSRVFKDLIKEHGGQSIDGDDDDDEFEEEDGYNTTTKKKKKKKKETLVSLHRDQFKEAFDLLTEAVNIYFQEYGRNKDEYFVPKSQINKWKHLLQSNDIHHLVINDVIDFAITTNLFIKEEKHESDIDSSDESIEMFKDDQNYILQQKKIKHARMLDAPEEPAWFTKKNTDNNNEGESGIEGLEFEEKTQPKNTKTSFWNSFNKAKKDKKKNKKNKKEKKIKRNIELSKNVNKNYNNNNDDEYADDGDIENALDEWANE